MSAELILWSCCLVLLYAIIANRLLRFSAPVKARAIDLAGELSRDPRLSPERKREIETIVPLIATRRLAWMFAFGVSVSFFMILLRGRKGGEPVPGVPADRHKQWSTMTTLTTLGAVANSPLAALWFAMQVTCLTFFVSFAKLGDVLLLRSARHLSVTDCAGGPRVA